LLSLYFMERNIERARNKGGREREPEKERRI
jgi:hypothetical protein